MKPKELLLLMLANLLVTSALFVIGLVVLKILY